LLTWVLSCDRPAPPVVVHASAPARSADASPPAASSASPTPSAPTSATVEPSRPTLAVHLVPLGAVPPETIDATVQGLREHAPVAVVVEASRTPPDRAKSPRKGAWQASVLLDWLDGLSIGGGGKVMALTEAEMVTRKGNHPTWGILGMGSIDGRCSVISTYRMRRRWENGGAPESLVRERLWKIAIHELGHTLGLEHCPVRGCLMEDGHGTVQTVDRGRALCADCARRFEEALRRSAQ